MAENSDSSDRRSEIERILKLATDGKLTTAQAAELIAALGDPASPQADARPGAAAGADSDFDDDFDDRDATDADREERRHRRRRHRHRHRHANWSGNWGGFRFDGPDHLAKDIERAVEIGTRTLRSVFGDGFGRSGDGANTSVLSHAIAPTGSDYKCEGNRFAVCNVNGIRLTRSTFSNNHVNAADVAEIDLADTTFVDQHVNGSSLRQMFAEHAEIRGNELNGAQWSRFTIGKGRLLDNLTNGTQLRDVGISESTVESCRFNGTRVKTLVVNAASHVKDLTLDGVLGRNWLLEGAVIANTRINGTRVDGLVMKRSGLDGVTFERRDFSSRHKGERLGLIRDLSLERCVLKNCTFEDCLFDGTRFEGFDAANLDFDGVDFRGLTITTAADFARLAGDRRVA
jgi:uncharacterized protein YjbI with pentapeptide repeats